jgi:hypothetical protein
VRREVLFRGDTQTRRPNGRDLYREIDPEKAQEI